MVLEIKGLRVRYGVGEVVRGLDLEIAKGECVGLVGESGCGKTTVGLSITRLIPERKGTISSGRILLEGQDLLTLDHESLRKVRGKKVSYVFQEPSSSLNPVFTIYEQLKEALPGRGATDDDAVISDLLKSVGLAKIAGKKNIYPHELSGGMQQRVMIAMAIVPRPDLLVLDEPTTALDVTVQNQILDLIMELKNKIGLSVLFISHDLRTIFRLADRVAVMYAGRIIEEGPRKRIVAQPGHPYTVGLIDSIPSFEHRKKRFDAIEGRAPLFSDLPQGCKFHPRCKFKIDKCVHAEPELEELSDGHVSRCIRAKGLIANGAIKGS
ncbi:MAG: ABC transporter ATP-binding protein [Candidatus Omnitrophica bacterium]|nr:ABC transporter ATP-binding protein [Candidatus Omnitrophota bacterium]MBU4590121.1 ABC transporter ATP-binding protein [Candidatus Omnitrophota bacterium]